MGKLTVLIFLCLCLTACKQTETEGETVTVGNGVKIPIKACVEANTKFLGSSVDPIAFCKCLVPKFYADLKNDPEKLRLLKEGNWYDLSKEKQELVSEYYQGCISETATNDTTARFTVTPRVYAGLKKKMKQDLVGTEIEQANDVDKYCDCILNSMQTDFTVKEVMQDNFNETEKYKLTVDSCLKTTIRK